MNETTETNPDSGETPAEAEAPEVPELIDTQATPEEPAEEELPAESAKEDESEDKERAKPTDLQGDLNAVIRTVVAQEVKLPEGKEATPHILAGLVEDYRTSKGIDGGRPSGGAVADALRRWADVGFIETADEPFRFVDYTPIGIKEGLSVLKAQHRERRAAARAAEKEAEKAAEPETVDTPDTPEPSPSEENVAQAEAPVADPPSAPESSEPQDVSEPPF